MSAGTNPLHGDFGPPLSGGRRRPPGRLNWSRIALFVVGVLGVCVVAATITAAALVWYGESQISHADVDTKIPGDTDGDGSIDVPELTEVRNVLVVGSDGREGLEGIRTDTIMLVQLDPRRHGAAILSFPRDLLVERCDGTEGRINGAYQIGLDNGSGGPRCLVETIDRLTQIPIHHYIEVDFEGFVDVVDTLGGVELYLDEPIQDDKTKLDLPAGCVQLSGRDALKFVRVRQIDSDFGRIARQQRFIAEIVDQVTSAEVALDVRQLFRLVEAGGKAVETDPGLSLNVMRQIAFSFRDLSSDRIDGRTVPAFNRLISGVAYVVEDPEPAEALFAAFRAGVAAPADVGMKGPEDVSVADVPPITVLNATTTSGLASAAASALQARGFEVAGSGNAPEQNAQVTRILYPQRQREEARLILELFPGARLVAQDQEGFVVEVGADADREALLAVEKKPPTTAPPPEPEPTYAGTTDRQRRDC